MLQRASHSASASPSPIPFLMTQGSSAARSGSTPLSSSASQSHSPPHRTPASRHGNISPRCPSRRPAPVLQFLPCRERRVNRWTAVPVIHRQTLVSHLLDRSLARKPLVHTSLQSDPQDQPAIPTEAPQRDTVDNKLVSLTAVLPPPAGCEKCSLRGHRNHPRHSRQACRRSFESHCGEALDSRSLGRGRRSPAPRQSRCEMAHSQLGYATFTLRSMRRGGGARYRSCDPSLETRTRRLVLATGRRSERPLCRCQWRTGWQQTTEPASCDIMSSSWALEAAPTTNESTFNAKRSGQRALAEGGTAARWSERCGPRSVHSFVTRGNAERRDDISRS